MIKERIDYVWGTGMTNAVLSAYCTDRANLLLSQQGSALQRGAASTYRFPYHTSTAATTLVNAGDLVRLNISTKSINEDFLLLEYEYNEPPATTKMKFVTNVYGRGQSPFEIQSVLEGLRGGNDIVVTYARISDLIVDSAHINSLSASKITAGTLDLTKGINVYSSASGAGVIINTGGIEGKNTAGTSTFKLNTDGSGYLGLTANEAVTWDSAGMVNIKGAYIQNASITNASIISLSADKITAGTLNLSDGITIKSNSAATANYLSMNSSGLTGFGAAGTASFYLQAGDGMAYAGAGKVILSTAGVLVECSGGAYSLFTVQNTLSYKTTIFQRNTAGGGTVGEKIGLHINCSSGDVVITSNEDIYLAPSSYYVYPAADASATAYCLGSTALRWNVQGYKVRGDNRVKIPVGPNMYD
jgi:hypothetical protein